MELVVISGKGGTGKTTIAVGLAQLAGDVIKADCDVDAPNLYLMYKGENEGIEKFVTGNIATIDSDKCIQCGRCAEVCRFDAIEDFKINPYKCEGCIACSIVCPVDAIDIREDFGARTMITKGDHGIISRAEMEIGADGSGKLITKVRKNAEKVKNDEDQLIIVDGSPGTGCPVISSITNTDFALVVTEPTMSGMEDLKRVLSVCGHFGVKPLVCINKFDINEQVGKEIKDYCSENDYAVVGEIPYDDTVIKSINTLKPITEFEDSLANKAIQNMWKEIKNYFNK